MININYRTNTQNPKLDYQVVSKSNIDINFDIMKRILLKNYIKPSKGSNYIEQNRYRVALDEHRTFSFTSEKKLHNFLKALSDFLNTILIELINHYTDIHKDFWLAWFYLDPKINSIPSRDIQARIEYNLSTIPKFLNLLITKQNYTNGSYFVFIHMRKILNALELCTIELLKVYESRNDSLTKSLLQAKLDSFKVIRQRISFTNIEEIMPDTKPSKTHIHQDAPFDL